MSFKLLFLFLLNKLTRNAERMPVEIEIIDLIIVSVNEAEAARLVECSEIF
jgi:hypothetical protein